MHCYLCIGFSAGFDLVLISDCLFIAVRDYLFTQLRSAMVTACTSPGDAEGTLLLFAYEERLTQEEHEFLNDLETNPAIAAGAAGAVQTFTSTEVSRRRHLTAICTAYPEDVATHLNLLHDNEPIDKHQAGCCLSSGPRRRHGFGMYPRRGRAWRSICRGGTG